MDKIPKAMHTWNNLKRFEEFILRERIENTILIRFSLLHFLTS